jgi:hypothetical protein
MQNKDVHTSAHQKIQFTQTIHFLNNRLFRNSTDCVITVLSILMYPYTLVLLSKILQQMSVIAIRTTQTHTLYAQVTMQLPEITIQVHTTDL